MRYIIHKGGHWAWPMIFGIWHKKYAIRKMVVFGYGCNYTLDGGDQDDTNKLFGIGYFWNHHKESARFGWCSVGDSKIQVNAYLYIGGQRVIEQLCTVPAGFHFEYHLVINHALKYYTFKVKNPKTGVILVERDFMFNHNKKWSFPLHIYFGGNRKAPREINIEIKPL